MAPEPAGARRSQTARRRRAASPESEPTRNGATGSAGPSPRKGNSRGPNPGVGGFELGGLDAPPPEYEEEGLFESDEAPGQLSAPVNEAPGQLIAPKTVKPTHLATVRFRIALFSIAILAFVVVAAFVTLWKTQPSIDNLTRVLEIIFAPLVALVGVAVAFYYRSNPPV